ncbi:uncharacterized protein [Ptychodera flava]|uniref:uncharacterized protein n=1 Tax=Ptychodera flava TaxID=63121 RepID=UPI00396A6241
MIMKVFASRKIRFIFLVILLVGIFLCVLNLYGVDITLQKDWRKCSCVGQPSCLCDTARNYDVSQRKTNIDRSSDGTSRISVVKNPPKNNAQKYFHQGKNRKKKTELHERFTTTEETNDTGRRQKESNKIKKDSLSKNAVKQNKDTQTNQTISSNGSSKKRQNNENTMKNGAKIMKDTNERQHGSDYNGKSVARENKECKIPRLDPFHSSLKHLFEKPSILQCQEKNGGPDLTYFDTNENKVYINHTVLGQKTLNICSYSYIVMLDDSYTVFNDSIIIEFDENTDFTKDILLIDNVISDYFGTVCYAGNDDKEDGDIYRDLHAHIVPQPDVFLHAEQVKPLPSTALGVDVIIVGFDSTSHMNFIRQMPKSYKFLTSVMQSTVLNGFNIVGDATSAALIPMLTGQFPQDLPEARRNTPGATTVDVFPLIWNQFKQLGYVTLFAEDSPYLGAFNRLFNGFENQPTDHYMRTFWLKSVELTEDYNSISNPKMCQGAQPSHRVMFEYLKEFQIRYKDIHKFGFMFLTELTHGNINSINLADDDFYEYLKFMYLKKYLENTLFIVLGDHGARYTAIRATLQGRLEERLPFVSIHIPKTLRRTHPWMFKNLKINADRLTTAFDFHAMLEDVINYSPEVNDSRRNGQSLFKEISSSRTCRKAHIAKHWCTCLDWVPVEQGNEKVQHAAGEFVKYINNLTEAYREHCAILQLKNISHAERNVPNNKVLRFKGTWDDDQRFAAFEDHVLVDVHEVAVDYQITIETVPGHGLFEGTVKVFTDDEGKDKCVVDAEISRINLYGNQPKCIAEKYPHITKYCYCKKQ